MDYGALLSRDLRLLSKYASNMPRVNLRQITLLRGYIHPNEQPVIYLYHKCFVFFLHIDDFIYIAHAQKHQSERL